MNHPDFFIRAYWMEAELDVPRTKRYHARNMVMGNNTPDTLPNEGVKTLTTIFYDGKTNTIIEANYLPTLAIVNIESDISQYAEDFQRYAFDIEEFKEIAKDWTMLGELE